jgi:Tol biopolymer transport system component
MRLSPSSRWGALFVLLILAACSPVRQIVAPTTISQLAATPTRLPLTAVASGIYVPAYVPPAIATNLTNPGGTSAMAFSSGPYGNAGIYLADFANKTITQLTKARGNSFNPDWSPDGMKIIFRTDRDGKAPFTTFEDGEIYVMNADGSNQTNLTNNPANDGWPKWSPDGTRIVFASYRDDRPNTEVYVMNADGSGVTQLTDIPGFNNEDVAWSPDGNKIAFKSYRDGNWEIYTMNANGSGQTRLTKSPGEDSWPNWSPDGKHIVFETQRVSPDNYDLTAIYMMNSDGTNPTQVIPPGPVSSATWSPDGSEIAFYANGDQGEGIFMVNVASGEIVKLISGSAGDPSWRPIKP